LKMKNGLRKTKIIVALLFICFICCAYAFWEDIPDLINADKPFIDLTDSIGKSIGNAEDAYRKANPTPIPTPIPKPTPEITPEPTPTEIPPEENVIKLYVGDGNTSGSGEIIYFDDKAVNSYDELKDVVLNLDLEDKVIVLVDCYAEKEAFINVMKVLAALDVDYRTETYNVMLGGAE